MGFWDKLDPSGGQDKYIIVARSDKMEPVKMSDKFEQDERTFYEEPMTKDAWEQEHFDKLEEGVTYYCVEASEKGYSLDDPEWTLEIEGEDSAKSKDIERVRDEIDELKEKLDEDSGTDLDLTHVDDTEEIQARVQGAAASRGLEIAEDIEDVKTILESLGNAQQTQNGIVDIITGVDNQLAVNSMTDLALLMTLPQLQQATAKLPETLENANGLAERVASGEGLLGGGATRSDGAEDEDKVTLDRERFERLKAAAENGRRAGRDDDEPEEVIDTEGEVVDSSPAPDETEGGESFSMDDLMGDEEEEDDLEADVDEPEEVLEEDVDESVSDDEGAEEVLDEDQDDIVDEETSGPAEMVVD